jgi:hypothetical protein
MTKASIYLLSLFALFACSDGGYPDKALDAEHLFSFHGCTTQYNGAEFSVGDTLDNLREVFGKETRIFMNRHVVWEDKSLKGFYDPETGKVMAMILNLRDPKEKVSFNAEADYANYISKNHLEGAVLYSGIPVDGGFHEEAFLDELKRLHPEFESIRWEAGDYEQSFRGCERGTVIYNFDLGFGMPEKLMSLGWSIEESGHKNNVKLEPQNGSNH